MDGTLQEAAVLVLTFKENGTDRLVFTRRTEEVLHHKGQICFPGGASDPGDESLWKTALRETHEEIGVDPSLVSLIKELKPQTTPTGFRVTPFFGSLAGPTVWRPNPREIAEIFTVPVTHLRDPRNIQFTRQVWEGREYVNPSFSYRQHVIWGVTGRILCDLLEIRL
jgi:8-oxo-dGTP pyrophosphatase MutT (NUDIX family)